MSYRQEVTISLTLAAELQESNILTFFEKKRIFTRFYRASNATAVKTDASVLGLSIAHYYIEQHGGTIWFTSDVGKGGTF